MPQATKTLLLLAPVLPQRPRKVVQTWKLSPPLNLLQTNSLVLHQTLNTHPLVLYLADRPSSVEYVECCRWSESLVKGADLFGSRMWGNHDRLSLPHQPTF